MLLSTALAKLMNMKSNLLTKEWDWNWIKLPLQGPMIRE
jgi:hypothetical protein